MLRRILLYLSAAKWARRIVTRWGVARTVARRFIAGETINDALNASQALNDQGLLVSLDYLGESVESADDTKSVVNTYAALIDLIHQRGLKAGVSLKLTHLGLDISEELCLLNLRTILTNAKTRAVPVTIDMESTAYTEKTLQIYRTMRHEYEFDSVGTVIQAYLFRTGGDMRALAEEGATIRLCKGAYLEPPTLAFPEKADVDKNYVDVMRAFLASAPPAFLQLATHDENIIQVGADIIRQGHLHERVEFQMLYGIRSSRQLELAREGFPVRVYVPFGEAWYPYFMRRLAERPANLWFFARSLFKS